MSTDTTHATIDNDAAPRVFERIVVGVDDSPEALEAALQAASLRSARGTLDLCAVVESPRSVHGGFLALAIAGEMERASGEALDRAARRTRPTTTTVLHGKSVPGDTPPPCWRWADPVTSRDRLFQTTSAVAPRR